MKNLKSILIVIILLCISISNAQSAFPNAVGFGKNATGGKGGTVLFVTNLSNSGSGSLRAALEASGTRTIIFKVGGTIHLTSNIWINNGNLTVAGQTAPGGGILITGGMVQVEASNVIIRYIRFRMKPINVSSGYDAFSITASSGVLSNVYIDHCSFSWGDDENFNMRGSTGTSTYVKDVTVANCLIAEGGYGVLLYQNVQTTSFYQNLMAFNSERNIRANYGFDGIFKFEMINNLIYGWNIAATNPSNGQKYTILNNKYKLSTSFTYTHDKTVIGASAADATASDSWTYAYIDGNIIPSGWSLNASRVNPYLKTTPFATSGLTAISYAASDIETNILNHVGASRPIRDAVDTRIINSYIAGTGNPANSGTQPTIANGTPYTDSDSDGMEDSWEISNFGNLTKNNNGFDLNATYTNLQMFLSYKADDASTPIPPVIPENNFTKNNIFSNFLIQNN